MDLILSEKQAVELRRALELHLHRLAEELVHTEDHDYREGLKESYDELDGVRSRLESQLESAQEVA